MVAPTRDELIRLREKEGMTREDIAEHFDVSVATVRRWIKELDVPRPSRQGKPRHRRLTCRGEIIGRADDGITVLERAREILGSRLTERRGYGYFLDGRPTHIDRILSAAGLL